MKNTLENKSKFFAQYWWQEILTDGVQTHNISPVFNLKHPSFYLKLTPLSQITDEDAVEVAELHYGRGTVIQTSKERYIKNVGKYVLHNPEYIASKIADFLRSKGYALPYMGLSVEELISYGWVKLKEDNQ